jgi:hypothetical protein
MPTERPPLVGEVVPTLADIFVYFVRRLVDFRTEQVDVALNF